MICHKAEASVLSYTACSRIGSYPKASSLRIRCTAELEAEQHMLVLEDIQAIIATLEITQMRVCLPLAGRKSRLRYPVISYVGLLMCLDVSRLFCFIVAA